MTAARVAGFALDGLYAWLLCWTSVTVDALVAECRRAGKGVLS